MNFREGTKRMRILGMAMTLAPLLAGALYTLYEIQPIVTHAGFGGFAYHFSRKILAAALVLAVPGLLVLAAGWVVDGFGKEPR